jgi:hypothetical protein
VSCDPLSKASFLKRIESTFGAIDAFGYALTTFATATAPEGVSSGSSKPPDAATARSVKTTTELKLAA